MKSETKTAKSPPADKTRFTGLLSGILIAYAITCISFIACALLLTYTSLSEERVPIIMILTVLVSVTVAGFDAAKKAGSKGWLWGMAAGAIYAFILICIETWVSDGFLVDSKTVSSVVLSVAGGGFGGIIGINFRKKR